MREPRVFGESCPLGWGHGAHRTSGAVHTPVCPCFWHMAAFPCSPRDSGPQLGLSCFSTPSHVPSSYGPSKQSKWVLAASAESLAWEASLCRRVSLYTGRKGSTIPRRLVFNMPNKQSHRNALQSGVFNMSIPDRFVYPYLLSSEIRFF